MAKVPELASDMLEAMVVVLAFFADVPDVDESVVTDVVPTADMVCSTTVESVIKSTAAKTI